MKEKNVVQKIRLATGMYPDLTLFVNTTAYGWTGNVVNWDKEEGIVVLKKAHPATFGLEVGSADLIGWRTINGIAQFCAFEVKTDTGTPSEDQLNFIKQVNAAGGLAGVVRSAKDVDALLQKLKGA